MNILEQYQLKFVKESVFGSVRAHCIGNSGLANFLDTTIYEDTLQEGIQRCKEYLNNQINSDGINSINGELYFTVFDTIDVDIYEHFGDSTISRQNIPLEDFTTILEMWFNFIHL